MPLRTSTAQALAPALLAALAGCSGGTLDLDAPPDGPGASAGGPTAGTGGSPGASGEAGAGGGPALPKLSDLEPGKLNIIRPGGDSICGRGTEYAFFVIPGDPKKLIVEFEGGGACWNESTCALGEAGLFKDSVDPAQYTGGRATQGWYDHARAGHPMPDWTHVYVPYCTGDVHWGDSVKTYGALTIRHKGAVNARTVLDWTYSQIDAPDKVFVTGCSAGGYGSVWWAPYVQQHYAASKVYHFADSSAGVITDDFFQMSFPSWNAQASFPAFVGDFTAVTTTPLLYTTIAGRYPQNVYSQYNTVRDENQTLFYSAMGGDNGADGWSAGMKANVKAITAGASNFRAFIAEGEQHCILPYDNFYTVESAGVKLTTWLSDMVNDRPVADAYCEGCTP